ncbi:DUF2914 domain-containing protein [Marinomonas mediterranea]|jgi:Protein of unknown function (DUF2914).|uniref:DUF2914 domain-containing protein n=1 Tax=Marinomonas mediterranea (strain ATCC 700492 / JCM 21426 / NBRC 103028 / MMB-1) TaxID=717774 RepID=F2JTP7_MARM1|nr:DUF2914 domain-containing protein [Marinomonas mediterranea]ADZ92667.1 hypothetical protein Marme_3451 [Marinomonas mediterranea MMB-1]WCN10603.1 DUF2914 domain-containing protein [Marinomonas mediterranea]WCN14654.1 DUF2914 domain-containing protein [Marinomonas mediterranea]WCN18699.1 DUF2914 domain-containing protein [Marinomonas mediterranea MMB-1]
MRHSFQRAFVYLILIFAAIGSKAWAEGYVARAQFSSDVVEREPIDDIGNVINVEYGEIQRVYFFTDLRDMKGSQVIHRWLLDGDVQVEIPFDIGGDRWRVWSSKKLMPGFDGKWTVEVVKDGNVVSSYSFDYVDEY